MLSQRYGYLEGRENITAALMSDVGFKEEVARAVLDFQVTGLCELGIIRFFLLLNIILFSTVLCGSECNWKSGHRYSLQYVHSPLWCQGYRRTRSKN